jgi:hypothetical protein
MGNTFGSENKDGASGSQGPRRQPAADQAKKEAVYNSNNQFEGPALSRSATFDDRRMERVKASMVPGGRGGGKGHTSDFAPLSKKALTFHSMRDSNLQESKVTFDMYNVEDVLFRRHFNAQPLQPALSFVGEDQRGTIARGFAKEGKDVAATLQAALDEDPDTQPAVVVVDPFSTGAIVAKGVS